MTVSSWLLALRKVREEGKKNAPWQKQLRFAFSAALASNALSSRPISSSSLTASSDSSSSGSGSSLPLPLPLPPCAPPESALGAGGGAIRTCTPPATGARGTLGARPAGAPSVRGLLYGRAPLGTPNGLGARELAGVLAQDEVPLAAGAAAVVVEAAGAEGKR